MYDSDKDQFVKIKKHNFVYNTNPRPINTNSNDDSNDIQNTNNTNNTNNVNNTNNINNANNIPIKINSCCSIM